MGKKGKRKEEMEGRKRDESKGRVKGGKERGKRRKIGERRLGKERFRKRTSGGERTGRHCRRDREKRKRVEDGGRDGGKNKAQRGQ